MVGHFPDFLHGIVCRLLGERFVVECGILSAYHIEQDTKPSHIFSVKHLPVREPIFYFLPAKQSRAGLCKAFRKNTASAARKIFAETRKGPALLNPSGTG
jgi:hypothetical protein